MNFNQIEELAWRKFCESTKSHSKHMQPWHNVSHKDKNKYMDKALQILLRRELQILLRRDKEQYE